MDKPTVTRPDPDGAIGKARAAAALLDMLYDGDGIDIPYLKMSEKEKADMRGFMHAIAFEALNRALDDIDEAVFGQKAVA